MMKKIFFPALMVGVALLTGCEQKPESAELTILTTTDLHGSVLSYDFNADREARTSLSNVMTFVEEQRSENPGGVILLDGGDFLQGQPSIYYSNFVDTASTHIQARVMNMLGYDAATVGNHDIEPGDEVYDRFAKDLNFPWIAANAIDTRTGKPYFTPYTIIERKGLKIAVIGMITPNIHAWLPKNLWPNIEFQDMVECAAQWVPVIQKKEKPDFLIGLFHTGADYSVTGGMDAHMNENGGIPAATKVDGFDLIILGHDHQSLATEITNNFGNTVKVINAQTSARYVGKVDVKFTKSGKGYDKDIQMKLVECDKYAKNEKFEAEFAPFISQINEYVSAEIGSITETIYGQPGLFGPSVFMDLIHEAQLEATGADVSFAGILSANAVIKSGKITMRELFTLYKYENLLFTMELTGQEIKDFLEYGFSRQFNQMSSVNDLLLNYVKDENGNLIMSDRFGYKALTPSFNYTSAAGIRHTVDVTKPYGQMVEISSMSNGESFDLNKTYRVAVNSYQASGGGGFFAEGLKMSKEQSDAKIVVATSKDVRRFIADYIRDNSPVTPRLRNDWKVIPENYYEQGMKKEIDMMSKK